MFLLDTDTLSLLLRGHPRVTERVAKATEEVAITLITRIEILQGRFAFVLKAESGEKRLQAQQRLRESEDDRNRFTVVAIGPRAAEEFDRRRTNKRLKTIGRADLLSAPGSRRAGDRGAGRAGVLAWPFGVADFLRAIEPSSAIGGDLVVDDRLRSDVSQDEHNTSCMDVREPPIRFAFRDPAIRV